VRTYLIASDEEASRLADMGRELNRIEILVQLTLFLHKAIPLYWPDSLSGDVAMPSFVGKSFQMSLHIVIRVRYFVFEGFLRNWWLKRWMLKNG